VSKQLVCHEEDVEMEMCIDRWSKDLIGTDAVRTTSDFSIGVAVYTEPEFGERQRHDDQEAVYVVSGVGEILIGEETYRLKPGSAAYIAPGTVHATRRTTEEPVKVLYAHGAV
jgi:quercetin dioxygenase-like cupin family protein